MFMRLVIALAVITGAMAGPSPGYGIGEVHTPLPAGFRWREQALVSPEVGSAPAQPECRLGTVDQIEPADAITEVISGRDAWVFSETLMDKWDEEVVESMDSVLVMSGQGVWGGNVVFMTDGKCVLGYKFVTVLELIHAGEIIHLFATEPTLAVRNHLDEPALAALANAGNPVAQFHAGLVSGWGRGCTRDRPASVIWLRRAAEKGYAPAMLALGMALSGPDNIHDGVEFVGKPPATDELTDPVGACYWLFLAGDAPDPAVASAGKMYFGTHWEKMNQKDRTTCKNLLRAQ